MPISHRVELPGIARRSFYYEPKPISTVDLELMRIIDELHKERPTSGARMLRDVLKRPGYKVGRRHVASLMRLTGIEASYCKKRTTKRNPGHPVYPDLFPEVKTFGPGEHPFPTRYATRILTMFIEPNRYLRALEREAPERGGGIIVRSFASAADTDRWRPRRVLRRNAMTPWDG